MGVFHFLLGNEKDSSILIWNLLSFGFILEYIFLVNKNFSQNDWVRFFFKQEFFGKDPSLFVSF